MRSWARCLAAQRVAHTVGPAPRSALGSSGRHTLRLAACPAADGATHALGVRGHRFPPHPLHAGAPPPLTLCTPKLRRPAALRATTHGEAAVDLMRCKRTQMRRMSGGGRGPLGAGACRPPARHAHPAIRRLPARRVPARRHREALLVTSPPVARRPLAARRPPANCVARWQSAGVAVRSAGGGRSACGGDAARAAVLAAVRVRAPSRIEMRRSRCLDGALDRLGPTSPHCPRRMCVRGPAPYGLEGRNVGGTSAEVQRGVAPKSVASAPTEALVLACRLRARGVEGRRGA